MKPYWILWTYIANYGKIKLSARDPKHAADQLYACFSADFKERGTIIVFDCEPVLVTTKGEEIPF